MENAHPVEGEQYLREAYTALTFNAPITIVAIAIKDLR